MPVDLDDLLLALTKRSGGTVMEPAPGGAKALGSHLKRPCPAQAWPGNQAFPGRDKRAPWRQLHGARTGPALLLALPIIGLSTKGQTIDLIATIEFFGSLLQYLK